MLWILEEGPARPPARQLPLPPPTFLSLVHAASLEDLLSDTAIRLKLFVSSEATGVSLDEEENGHRRTIIGGVSFGPGLSRV